MENSIDSNGLKFYDRLRNKGFSGQLSWQLVDLYVEIDSLKKEVKKLKKELKDLDENIPQWYKKESSKKQLRFGRING